MTAGIADKPTLRRDALSRRAAIAPEAREAAAAALERIGLSFLDLSGPTIISGYHAIGEELDVLPLLIRLIGEGHVIGLPIVRKDKPLIFRLWTPETEMVRGAMGILRPSPNAPEVTPSVLLVPLAAFDARGFRVGYGGGYYDRTLSQLRAQGPVIAVGVAFAGQEVERVPEEPHDERLDWMLTPKGARRMEAA